MFRTGDPPFTPPVESGTGGVVSLDGVTGRVIAPIRLCAPSTAEDRLRSGPWLPRELGRLVAAVVDEGKRFGWKRARLALVGDKYEARNGVEGPLPRLGDRICVLLASTPREVDGEVLRRLGEGDSISG